MIKQHAPSISRDLLVFATQGIRGNEEQRIIDLLEGIPANVYHFDRKQKWKCFRDLLSSIKQARPKMVVMEGSGIAGGMALLLSRWLYRVPFVWSSGDAVGPWIGSHYRILGPLFSWYERLLYRNCSGFIGWTPYLAGRALTMGAPKAITAEGWAPFHSSEAERTAWRTEVRTQLQIPLDSIVIGIAGAIHWSASKQYCYGLEIVKALIECKNKNVVGLIVGDGSGRTRLEQLASEHNLFNIRFTGRVPQHEVPELLSAMDLGSMPQSLDQTGMFRYTTKISEYIDSQLPMVTGQLPMAYDLDSGWMYRLPGKAPWDKTYITALAELLSIVTHADITKKKACVPVQSELFNKERQAKRVGAFIQDILEESSR